eukprot:gnl/Spiro4/12807_TR6786_c0_g1_i1.p1 gnl/Spiro4/12807_TR6786_c0_g1~~gnl/Spiro4/12807_TR6786_c0_g1_i1.p1  ORF type:complete len:416 (+),score=51.75 gnl/Spiro4/12807_TR6786_c0_g1_i1:50-1249(+)
MATNSTESQPPHAPHQHKQHRQHHQGHSMVLLSTEYDALAVTACLVVFALVYVEYFAPSMLDWAGGVLGFTIPLVMTFRSTLKGAPRRRKFWCTYWVAYFAVSYLEQRYLEAYRSSSLYLAARMLFFVALSSKKILAWVVSTKLVRAIVFVGHVFVCLQILPLCYFFQEWWWRLRRCPARLHPFKQVTQRYICHVMEQYLNAKLVEMEGSAPRLPQTERAVYLLNHRCWGDFMVHPYLMEGTCASLSRLLVGAVFPVFVGSRLLDHSVWFFNNSSTTPEGRELFYKTVDWEYDNCTKTGMMVYPEGHRNTRETPLPLKRGLIYYAFSRQLPCQTIVTYKTERVIDEGRFLVQGGVRIPYLTCPPLYPKDFATREEFFDALEAQFIAAVADVWKRAPSLC